MTQHNRSQFVSTQNSLLESYIAKSNPTVMSNLAKGDGGGGGVYQYPLCRLMYICSLVYACRAYSPSVQIPIPGFLMHSFILLILDGNSEIGVHVNRNICYLFCLTLQSTGGGAL